MRLISFLHLVKKLLTYTKLIVLALVEIRQVLSFITPQIYKPSVQRLMFSDY